MLTATSVSKLVHGGPAVGQGTSLGVLTATSVSKLVHGGPAVGQGTSLGVLTATSVSKLVHGGPAVGQGTSLAVLTATSVSKLVHGGPAVGQGTSLGVLTATSVSKLVHGGPAVGHGTSLGVLTATSVSKSGARRRAQEEAVRMTLEFLQKNIAEAKQRSTPILGLDLDSGLGLKVAAFRGRIPQERTEGGWARDGEPASKHGQYLDHNTVLGIWTHVLLTTRHFAHVGSLGGTSGNSSHRRRMPRAMETRTQTVDCPSRTATRPHANSPELLWIRTSKRDNAQPRLSALRRKLVSQQAARRE